MSTDKSYSATAFVSCSLRKEDEDFVNHVCEILEEKGIKPFGTVGKFSASPENPSVLMNKNIPKADVVVICATPRYAQIDMNTGKKSKGLSEMVHVEAGMAIAHNKPVLVFSKEGTNLGNFLPNITQYITLDGTKKNYIQHDDLITSLCENALSIIRQVRDDKSVRKFGKFIVIGFAIYGAFKFVTFIFKRRR